MTKATIDSAVTDVDFTSTKYQIKLETTAGDILLELFPEVAPGHCKNMIGLARTGFYDNLIFHRVISGFMVQGGCPEGTGTGSPGYNIDAEFSNTAHEDGTLSMARATDPNSAGSQFFICLGPQSFLDGQYTAFGKTADDASLRVIHEIGMVETNSGDKPLTEVKINKATVIEN